MVAKACTTQEPKERVKRPGFGSLGRSTKLRANYFSINFSANQAVFYHVHIQQARRGAETEGEEGTLARALPRAKARAVIDALAKSQQWPAGWAYDDQHTLVSSTYFIDQAEHSYEVQAVLPDRERPSRFTVTVKYTSNIALQELADYCRYLVACAKYTVLHRPQPAHGAASPHRAAIPGHCPAPCRRPPPPRPAHRLGRVL